MTAAGEALRRALAAASNGLGEDVVALELREALQAFWQAEGVLVKLKWRKVPNLLAFATVLSLLAALLAAARV